MLQKLLERLRLATQFAEDNYDKDYRNFYRMKEQKKLEYLELRIELEQYKAEREAELEHIAQAMSDLDYADAMADSFRGGPDADTSY